MRPKENTFQSYYKVLANNFDNSDIIKKDDIEKINNFLQKEFIDKIDETYFNDNWLNQKFFDELQNFIKNKFNNEKLIKYILDWIQKYNNSSIFEILPIEDRTTWIKTSFLKNLDIKSFFEKNDFEISLKGWFYPISYTKLETWYYTEALTSNLQYIFRINEKWEYQFSRKTDFNIEDIKDFLEEEQANIKIWWINNKIWYINPDTKIIPIEKMKKLNIEWLINYINHLEENIEKNLYAYKKRVIQIQNNWSKDF